MMTTTEMPLPSRSALTAEHEAMNTQFEHVLAAFAKGERSEIAERWCALEAALRAHMAREEQRLLPVLALAEPGAAARLLEDHDYFRRKLGELGVANDLHAARLENARELVAKLRTHMASEMRSLYRCAADD